jgi:hypothetical protein
MSGEGPFPEDAGVSSDSTVPGDVADDEDDESDESDEPSYELLGDAGNPFNDAPPPEGTGPSADGAAARPGTGGQSGLNPETDDEVDRAERHD